MRKTALVLFGLALGLAALEGILQATKFLLRAHARAGAAGTSGRTRILCLGESTTARTLPWDHSWPRQLEGLLNAQKAGFKVVNAGLAGTSTTVLLDGLEAALEQHRPAAVVAMMGVNDNGWFGPVSAPPARRSILNRAWSSTRLARCLGFALHEWSRPAWRPPAGLRPKSAEMARALRRPKDKTAWARVGRGIERDLRAGRRPEPAALLWYLKNLAEARDFASGDRLLALISWEMLDSDPLFLAAAGLFRSRQGRPGTGLPLLRRALAKAGDGCDLLMHIPMIREFGRHGALEDARELVERDIARCPRDPLLPQEAILHARQLFTRARVAEGVALFHRAAARAGLNDRPRADTTEENWRALAAALKRRGIPLIAMQYPTRSLAPLQATLRGHPEVLFVSNEENFQAALARASYNDIFRDRFAGDFGHCTERGDRLIAEAVLGALREAGIAPREPAPMAESP